jgi:hypothetical protein
MRIAGARRGVKGIAEGEADKLLIVEEGEGGSMKDTEGEGDVPGTGGR